MKFLYGWMLGAVATASLFAGCKEEERDSRWDATLSVDATFALGSGFALVASPINEIATLTPEGTTVARSQSPLEGGFVTQAPLPDGGVALVTSEPALRILGSDGATTLALPLPDNFDRVTVSDDGRFVMLWFSPGYQGSDEQLFFQPNQLAWIDLNEAAPTLQTHALNGPRPSALRLLPPVTLRDGSDKRFYAFVSGQNAVSWVDLTTASTTDRQRLVRLADPASGASVSAYDLVIGEDLPDDPNDLTFFLRLGGQADVMAVSMTPGLEGAERDVEVSVNLLGLGAVPTALYRLPTPGSKLLALVQGRNTGYLMDGESGAVEEVDFGVPASNIVFYGATGAAPQMLVYASNSTRLLYADVALFVETGASAGRLRTLAQQAGRVTLDASGTYALVSYAYGGGIAVLDLDRQTEVALPSRGTLNSVVLADGYAVASFVDDSRIAWLDIATQRVSVLELDEAVSSMTLSRDGKSLLASHYGTGGRYSFVGISSAGMTRKAAYQGFFYDGLLGRDRSAQ